MTINQAIAELNSIESFDVPLDIDTLESVDIETIG